MKKFFKSLYITNKFYAVALSLAAVFIVGYFYHPVFAAAKAIMILIGVLFLTDLLMLYRLGGKTLTANRILPDRFSNGDKNKVSLELRNHFPFVINIKIIDEIPFQFQERKFLINRKLKVGQKKNISYMLRPTERGEYEFGHLNIYVSNFISFIERRFIFSSNQTLPVYPSFIHMRQYELMAISDRLSETGSKKIRRISNNREFEQIKEYVQGDDYRTVNWKATARMSKLMVNQYQDEKAQHVYNIIDLGRTMKMPFNEMSLCDYAINAALALSDVSLIKDDKAGLITYSDKIHRIIKADKKSSQMRLITDALFKEKTNFLESDYEQLYYSIRTVTSQRSLLIIYSNFESLFSLDRQLKMLKMLAKYHLVLVVFFKNTEIDSLVQKQAETTAEIYFKTIAEKMIFEKRQIVKVLKQNGIYSVLTEPENLTVETINAYLKMKSEGLL